MVLDTAKASRPIVTLKPSSEGAIFAATAAGIEVYRYNGKPARFLVAPLPEAYQGSPLALVLEKSSVTSSYDDTTRIATPFWIAGNYGVARFILEEKVVAGDEVAVSLSKNFSTGLAEKAPLANPSVLLATGLQLDESRIRDLALDEKNGLLYISQGNRLTRYRLGFHTDGTAPTTSDLRCYPNPFSLSNHQSVTLEGGVPGGFIDIYSTAGVLVAHLTATNGGSVEQKSGGWRWRWTPPQSLSPGVYMVVSKSSSGNGEISSLVVHP